MNERVIWLGDSRTSARVNIAHILAVAVTYHLLAQIGLFFAIPPGFATVFWPASGVGLAAVLIRGPWMMLGVVLGSFSVNLFIALKLQHQALSATSVGIALGIAISSALQAGLGAWLIRRWLTGYRSQLAQLRYLLILIGLGGPLGCTVAATGGTSILVGLGVMSSSQWWHNWLTWWMGDTLGVVVIAPALVILAQSSASVSALRKLQVCVPLVVLFSLLAFGYAKFEAETLERFDAEVDNLTDGAYLDVQGQLLDYERTLIGVVSYFRGSESISDEEFDAYTQSLVKSFSSLVAVQWVPRVDKNNLGQFEQQAQQSLGTEYRVHGQDDKSLSISLPRDFYYPVRYLRPLKGNEAVLGFDMSSSSERLSVIEQALQTGRSVATSPISLLQSETLNQGGQESSPEKGFLIVFPIQPSKNQNVIVGVYRISPVFRSVSHRLASFPVNLRVTDANSGDEVYRWGTNSGSDGWVKNEFTVVKTVAFGQRSWLMQFSPSVEFVSQYLYRYMAPVLLSAIAFLGLLSLFILSTAVNAMTLEQEIKKAETELKNEENFLSAVIDNLPSAVEVREADSLRCIKINKQAKKLWCLEQGETYAHYEQWQDSDEASFQRHEDSRVIKLGEIVDLAMRKVIIHGAEKWINIKKIPVRDGKGNVKYIISLYDDVSERKEESETFNSVVENLPSSLLIVNDYARIEYANPAAFAAFPLDKKLTPLNRVIPERFHQSHAKLVKAFMERKENRRMAPARNLFAVNVHGDEVPVEVTLAAIRWRGRAAVMALVHDLSERRRAENAEIEAKQFFRSLLEGMGECVWSVTTEGNATFINPALCELLGYTVDELIGKNVDHLIAYDDDANIMERVNPVYVAMHKMQPVKGTKKFLRAKDGTLYPVDYVVTPQINLSEEAEGAIVVAADIRERLESMEKLQSQHELISLGLDASGLGWWQWHASTNQIDCDDNLMNIFGLEVGQPYGSYRDFLDRVHPDDRDEVEAKTNKFSHYTDLYEMQYRIVRPDETVRWIHVRARYDIDDDGNPIKMQGVAWDCTEQKKTEMTLAASSKTIEDKNSQFAEYAHVVQGEILPPIQTLTRMVQRLLGVLDKRKDSIDVASAHEMRHLGETVTEKVQELMYYAEVESKPLNLGYVDVTEVVNGLIDLFLPEFKHAKVDCRIETPLPRVKADQDMLEEVFKRLIKNAISGNESNPIKVRIGCANQTGLPVFYVSDNGPGVDPLLLDTVFTPRKGARQNDRDASTVGMESDFEKTDLNLRIVHAILSRHNGHFRAESRAGDGADVLFSFSAAT